MKAFRLALSLWTMAIPAFGQAVSYWQREAITRYPALAQEGSLLHTKFIGLYNEAKSNNAQLLSQPEWPVILAERAARALDAEKPAPQTKTQTENGQIASNEQRTNFIVVEPFKGVSLDIPRSWEIVDPTTTEQVVTAVEAAVGLKALPLPSGVKTFRPPLQGHGTNITVISRSGKFPTQETVAALSEIDRIKLEAGAKQGVRKVMESMGLSFEAFSGISTVRIGSYVGIRGVAVGKAGDVKISLETIEIPLGTRQISLALADQDGASVWKPILERAKSTLRIE